MPELADLFTTAASVLAGTSLASGPAGDLLARLEYLDGAADAMANRVALLRAAARFRRIFSMSSDVAPGLVALGAEVDAGCLGVADAPVGAVSGVGLSFRQAFESCVGEGVEFISQFATQDDALAALTDDEALAPSPALRDLWTRLRACRRDPQANLTHWMAAANLADGGLCHLPADLCLRRPVANRDLDPPWPLSTGCGAGADHLDATLHGLLELIERDAVAMWLRGGRRPRIVPPGPGAAVLDRLRGAVASRRTWLLDITTDLGVPVVAAIACNDDGFGLSRGFACRPTLAAAAEAALMELAQMELGYRLSAAKRSVRGEAALNDIDRQHIHRYTSIDVAATPALHPAAPPAGSFNLLSSEKLAIFAGVRNRLEAAGVEVYAVNLTRPGLGIPVVRAIAPNLEMGLASPPGQRLRHAVAQSGADPARPAVV